MRLIHGHADGARLDNVSASALLVHGYADGCEHRLPFPYAYADGGHHAYAHARVPLSRVYGNGHAALLDAAIHHPP